MIALDKLNQFCDKLKLKQLMKINMYKTYDDFLNKITFNDFEDREIYAEACAFKKEKGVINIYTLDREFKNYIKRNIAKYGVGLL